MRFSEEILGKIFKESFGDKIRYIDRYESDITIRGEVYTMIYDFIDESMTFRESSLARDRRRVGYIYISEDNIFSYDVDPSIYFSHYIIFFGHKLKKFIKSNQKRSRRKFLAK